MTKKRDYECGWLCIGGSRLQTFATVPWFTLAATFHILGKALFFSYVIAIIQTIEQRFGIPSTQTGFIVSSYEIGYMVTIFLGSYIASRYHIPRFISITCLGLIFAFLMWVLPYFIYPPKGATAAGGTSLEQASAEMCQEQELIVNISAVGAGESPASSGNSAYLIFAIGTMMAGAFGAPGSPISASYIDLNIKAELSALYIGIVMGAYPVGQVLGFMVASWTLSWPETPGVILPKEQHVGCWWAGFVFFALMELLAAFPLTLFPKKVLPDKKAVVEKHDNVEPLVPPKDDESSPKSKKTLKWYFCDFFICLKRLLYNPVFLFSTLSWCVYTYPIMGMWTFMPKYFETQFGMSRQFSNIMTGLGGIQGGIVLLIGGGLATVLKLRQRGLAIFFCIGMTVPIAQFIIQAYITCPQAGVYFGLEHKVPPRNESCNCNCSPFQHNPVCDPHAHITYPNPCLAGCESQNGTVFENCRCAANSTLQKGPCQFECVPEFWFYYAVAMVLSAATGACWSPSTTLLLESCAEREKTMAVAIQWGMCSILGWLPAPILFGAILDSQCHHWASFPGLGKYCAMYDLDGVRLILHWVAFGFQVASALLAFVCLYYVLRIEKRKKEDADVEMENVSDVK